MVLLPDVARERGPIWLEIAVVILIVLEIILGIVHFA